MKTTTVYIGPLGGVAKAVRLSMSLGNREARSLLFKPDKAIIEKAPTVKSEPKSTWNAESVFRHESGLSSSPSSNGASPPSGKGDASEKG